MAVEACLYNIQIIGEAVSHLPEEITKKKRIFHGYSLKACATGLFTNILELIYRWFRILLKTICRHLKLNLKKFNQNF